MEYTKQYYTPELSEFCEGFEFERLDFEHWVKYTFSPMNVISHAPLLMNLKKIRVKSLDQADIESLGFVVDSGYGYAKLYQREDCDIMTQNGKYFKIHSTNGSYEGTVRNKFHLSQILRDIC